MATSTEAVKSARPIRCVVIQMARMGDTIQSLMALRAAKQIYPHLEITFISRERFSEAAKRASWIKEMIPFPTQTILGPSFQDEPSQSKSLDQLRDWISPLLTDRFDLLINWSYSESSSYLAALIPAKVKLGYTRRQDSAMGLIGAEGWSHYIQATIQSGVQQNIHLVDILTTQLLTALQMHFGESNGNQTHATAKSFFTLPLLEGEETPLNVDPSKKWVALQIGAGREDKCWDASRWAKLCELILENHPEYEILLLGSSKDFKLAEVFLNSISPSASQMIHNFVGKTEFEGWAYLISVSSWLLSTDTAAIHLASVLGTRVLNVSVGPVSFMETGPYGNGHYVIAPRFHCEACHSAQLYTAHTCGRDITTEAVYAVWACHKEGSHFEKQLTHSKWSGAIQSVRAFKARVRAPQDGGGVVFESILKHPLSMNDWTAMVIGHIARSWYCGWVPPMNQELSKDRINSVLIQKLRQLFQSSQVLYKVCEQARRTSLLLGQKGVQLKSDKVMSIEDKEELNALGRTLNELEALIDRLAKSHPPLLAFSKMSKVLMHHLHGVHLSDLGKEAALCYKQLGEGALIFRDWVKFTLDLAKPTAVRVDNVSPLPSRSFGEVKKEPQP